MKMYKIHICRIGVLHKRFTENYARAVSNTTDYTIAATRIANNNLFASMDAWKNSDSPRKRQRKRIFTAEC